MWYNDPENNWFVGGKKTRRCVKLFESPGIRVSVDQYLPLPTDGIPNYPHQSRALVLTGRDSKLPDYSRARASGVKCA